MSLWITLDSLQNTRIKNQKAKIAKQGKIHEDKTDKKRKNKNNIDLFYQLQVALDNKNRDKMSLLYLSA